MGFLQHFITALQQHQKRLYTTSVWVPSTLGLGLSHSHSSHNTFYGGECNKEIYRCHGVFDLCAGSTLNPFTWILLHICATINQVFSVCTESSRERTGNKKRLIENLEGLQLLHVFFSLLTLINNWTINKVHTLNREDDCQ